MYRSIMLDKGKRLFKTIDFSVITLYYVLEVQKKREYGIYYNIGFSASFLIFQLVDYVLIPDKLLTQFICLYIVRK